MTDVSRFFLVPERLFGAVLRKLGQLALEEVIDLVDDMRQCQTANLPRTPAQPQAAPQAVRVPAASTGPVVQGGAAPLRAVAPTPGAVPTAGE